MTQNKSFLKLFARETDSLFIIEILLVFISYFTVQSLQFQFSSIHFGSNNEVHYSYAINALRLIYRASLEAGYGTFVLIYCFFSASVTALALETGSFGYLWTLPSNRFVQHSARYVSSLLPAFLLFSIPALVIGFIYLIEFPLIYYSIFESILLSSMLLYLGVGFFFASITKSALLTFTIPFIFFLIVPGNIALGTIDKSLIFYTIAGIGSIQNLTSFGTTWTSIFLAQSAIGLGFFLLSFVIISRRDLRAGSG
ncbi:MAG: hypothetical protein M1113_03610 [Candidatus Thermoplasmatota archaeon]|nr:hypothetical protein [Candidatus Thermoplasmatota archaeon]